VRAWLVLLAALCFGAAPFVTEGFAGFRPEQFPIPQNNAPVQPAGYAFSIWGVIYLWLLIYAVMGAWRYRAAPDWEAAAWPMVVSMGIGAVWIKVATLSVIWATGLIWAMLITALIALLQARQARPLWAIGLPIGLYAGWLSAASLVALGLTGAGYGVVLSQTCWAFGAIITALVLGTLVARAVPQIWSYPLALAWALTGIALANWPDRLSVAGLAGASAVFFAAYALWNMRIHLAPRQIDR